MSDIRLRRAMVCFAKRLLPLASDIMPFRHSYGRNPLEADSNKVPSARMKNKIHGYREKFLRLWIFCFLYRGDLPCNPRIRVLPLRIPLRW